MKIDEFELKDGSKRWVCSCKASNKFNDKNMYCRECKKHMVTDKKTRKYKKNPKRVVFRRVQEEVKMGDSAHEILEDPIPIPLMKKGDLLSDDILNRVIKKSNKAVTNNKLLDIHRKMLEFFFAIPEDKQTDYDRSRIKEIEFIIAYLETDEVCDELGKK